MRCAWTTEDLKLNAPRAKARPALPPLRPPGPGANPAAPERRRPSRLWPHANGADPDSYQRLPLLREGLAYAWGRGFLQESQALADYRLAGLNLGWEGPGIFDVALEFRRCQPTRALVGHGWPIRATETSRNSSWAGH